MILIDGESADAVHIEFEKCFDKIAHGRLHVKCKTHGIGGGLLTWLVNWLAQ